MGCRFGTEFTPNRLVTFTRIRSFNFKDVISPTFGQNFCVQWFARLFSRVCGLLFGNLPLLYPGSSLRLTVAARPISVVLAQSKTLAVTSTDRSFEFSLGAEVGQTSVTSEGLELAEVPDTSAGSGETRAPRGRPCSARISISLARGGENDLRD